MLYKVDTNYDGLPPLTEEEAKILNAEEENDTKSLVNRESMDRYRYVMGNSETINQKSYQPDVGLCEKAKFVYKNGILIKR